MKGRKKKERRERLAMKLYLKENPLETKTETTNTPPILNCF